MFQDMRKAIAEEYSGVRAKEYVADIIRFHRIQASPGFRAAAQHCQRLLAAWGVLAEVLSFPADERTNYWGSAMFQEWEASEGTLHLIEPAERACKLADFRETPISLIQRSLPVDGLETEVVLLEDGQEEAEYQGLDLHGKLVLTRGDLDRVRQLAVDRHGAAGILFDGMRDSPPVRQRIDLPDARQYTSFWWLPGNQKCFGFVLSPRQGEDLRKLIRSRQRDGKPPVRVRARVVSRLYDGQMEVVSALVPGETDEEVVVVAHLCHPQASANDNASGSAALLELARTLHDLIAKGRLLRPKRSIRLLWVAEMTGTYAYLATHEQEIQHILAGLNMDMVGEDQEQCGSVFIVERPPAALPSFTADLLERLREEWMGETPNLAGSLSYPLFRHTVSPFSGGSDHYILSDPSVGVPTPMLIQWPDKFYHTSQDTLDKVSPHMLGIVGGLATAYAYFVANAGEREACWLGHEMAARFRARLARDVQSQVTAGLSADKGEALAAVAGRMQKQTCFAADRQQAALRSLLRLAPRAEPWIGALCQEADQVARQELQRARSVLLQRACDLGLDAIPILPAREPDEWDRQAAGLVPVRRFRGPVSANSRMYRLPAPERDEVSRWIQQNHEQYYSQSTLAGYWVDGKRSVAEIADLVELEAGQCSVQLLVKHFKLLERLDLMALQAR